MLVLDNLVDDFKSGNLSCYNLAIAIFMVLGKDKLLVLRPYLTNLEVANMMPEQQVRLAFRVGAAKKILQKLVSIGENAMETDGQLLSYIDGEFVTQTAVPLLDSVLPVDDIVLRALDLLPLIQHPTQLLSESGKRRLVEHDISAIVADQGAYDCVYSGAEIAFMFAHIRDLKTFESMAPALCYFNSLQSRGLVSDFSSRSSQAGTVRWSVSCRVLRGDKWVSVVTPFCVSLQMARLMVMSSCYVSLDGVKRIAKLPLSKIYDRDRFQKIYKKSKKLLVEKCKIDMETGMVVRGSGTQGGKSFGVDLSAVVAFSLRHSVGKVNPMQQLSQFFSAQVSPEDFDTMVGATEPGVHSAMASILPEYALLALSATRHEFQDKRFDLGLPNLNKAACLGVSSVLYKRGDNSLVRTLRATTNLLEMIGDVINCCGGMGSVGSDTFLHIVWYTAIDMNPVIALCVFLRVNFIIQVGTADVFFFRGNNGGEHTSYDRIEGVMEEVVPGDDTFFEHQASVMANHTNSQSAILVCGGLSGSGMEKGASTMLTISIFYSLMKHIACGGIAPRYVYSDFVLPDACPHFRCPMSEIAERVGLIKPLLGCSSCDEFARINDDFARLAEEPCTALVKPRMAYAHNRHLGLVFDPTFGNDDNVDLTSTTLLGVMTADVWRCARDETSRVIIPKRPAHGGGLVDDTTSPCEENKIAAAHTARDMVYALKAGVESDRFDTDILSTISMRSASTGSFKLDKGNIMEVSSSDDSEGED